MIKHVTTPDGGNGYMYPVCDTCKEYHLIFYKYKESVLCKDCLMKRIDDELMFTDDEILEEYLKGEVP